MLLYIVRHGYAGQHGDPRYPNDALRPLTKKGQKEFSRVVKKLARRRFAPTLVASSPLVRCRQTADVIVERLRPPPELIELDSLQPGSDLEQLVAWSNEQQVDELAWVGHAPDVDCMAAALVAAREGSIIFAKGAVAAIEFDAEIGPAKGRLRWLATPKVLGA
jgi:phosphohistidine phosphatase